MKSERFMLMRLEKSRLSADAERGLPVKKESSPKYSPFWRKDIKIMKDYILAISSDGCLP